MKNAKNILYAHPGRSRKPKTAADTHMHRAAAHTMYNGVIVHSAKAKVSGANCWSALLYAPLRSR